MFTSTLNEMHLKQFQFHVWINYSYASASICFKKILLIDRIYTRYNLNPGWQNTANPYIYGQ